ETGAVGLAVLLDREGDQEGGVVGLRHIGVELAAGVLQGRFVLVERGSAVTGVRTGAGGEEVAVDRRRIDALQPIVADHTVDADVGVEVAGLDGLLQDGVRRTRGVGDDDEVLVAAGGQLAELGAIVGLAVFVADVSGNLAAVLGVLGLEHIGEALAVVVVHVG